MEVGTRKGTAKNVVVAGSVWESRMKSDEIEGGIKVYNAEEKREENGGKRLRPKQSPIGVNGKRKTWKSESSDGCERNPIQISRQRSEPNKDLGQQCKELSVSADGINIRSPIQKIKKTRSGMGKELSVSVDGIEKSPIRKMMTRSELATKELSVYVDGIERSPVQVRKAKSESQKLIGHSDGESNNGDEIERNPIQKMKSRSEEIKELSLAVRGSERNPVQVGKAKSESLKLIGHSDGESSNGDEIERNPIQKMKSRSEEIKELSLAVRGSERNPVQVRKAKSESLKLIGQLRGESNNDEENDRNSIQLRKVKSESHKGLGESVNGEGIKSNSVQLRKVKSQSDKDLGESIDANERNSILMTKINSVSSKVLDDGIERNSIELKKAKSYVDEIDKGPVGIEKTESDEFCKEFGVCEEKVVSSSLSNLGQVRSAPQIMDDDDEKEEHGDDDDDWDEEFDEEVEEEIEIYEETKTLEVKEIDINQEKPKQIVNEEKVYKVQPISTIVKKQVPPLVNHSRNHPISTRIKAIPVSNGFQRPPQAQTGFHRVPETHNKLQSLVDLVMWGDVSKSAFVFGLGTFIIISFSYTKDLNLSFITVVSYLGLVYLAAIFLFRSIICRGILNEDTNQCYIVGEEESIWLQKMILPYLNEFLLKFRALFSGDPATTMKLAVLLIVMARCGNSITIWKMVKLGFFGVFTVPKICSSYSSHLTHYGKFWVRRFKDVWDSCSHKKAVAFGIFTLVWNLSSVVARIWAVFMLYVAFRYYQQTLVTEDWVEEKPNCETTWQDPIGEHRRGRRTTTVDVRKDKKKF